MRKFTFLTLMMILGMSSIFFISPVFGGSYTLSCSWGDEVLPIKFKFSEDKNTSWIWLQVGKVSEGKWVELTTKKTEEYFFLTGLVEERKCYNIKKEDTEEYNLYFVYIIDRSSLRLYKKVNCNQEMPTNASLIGQKNCGEKKTWINGQPLFDFRNPCTVSKMKF